MTMGCMWPWFYNFFLSPFLLFKKHIMSAYQHDRLDIKTKIDSGMGFAIILYIDIGVITVKAKGIGSGQNIGFVETARHKRKR